jgi:recombination DNA repair RAD52 pathway protein
LRGILIVCGAVGALAVVVLAVVFVLAFLKDGSNETGSSDSSGGGGTQAASSTSSDQSEDSTNEEYAVGDTVDLSDRTFKVNEAEVDYLTFDQASWPKPGHQFVRANVILANTSTDNINFTPFDFQLEDASGVQRGYTIVEDMPNPLRSGNLIPNDAVTGNIAFDAPAGDAGFKLIYKSISSSSETATVNL